MCGRKRAHTATASAVAREATCGREEAAPSDAAQRGASHAGQEPVRLHWWCPSSRGTCASIRVAQTPSAARLWFPRFSASEPTQCPALPSPNASSWWLSYHSSRTSQHLPNPTPNPPGRIPLDHLPTLSHRAASTHCTCLPSSRCAAAATSDIHCLRCPVPPPPLIRQTPRSYGRSERARRRVQRPSPSIIGLCPRCSYKIPSNYQRRRRACAFLKDPAALS